MAPRLLSYPFRVGPSGTAVTVEQGSDRAHGEELAVLVLTRLGERILAPDYGVDDPIFDELRLEDVSAGVAMFGPPVDVAELETVFTDDRTQEVRLGYE